MTHEREAGEEWRSSAGQAVQRSSAARAKATSKRAVDGLPVHSIRGLIAELGTLTANTMQMADSNATFTIHTQAAELQQRCFELLQGDSSDITRTEQSKST